MKSSILPTSIKKINLVIVGQGAIGLLYYHHFSQQHYSVSLKPSSKMCSNTDEYSFTAYGENQENTFPLKYAQLIDIQQADIVIFCLKSYQVSNAAEELWELIAPNCLILLAHNGMGVYEEVIEYFPANQGVLAMLTTHGCLRTDNLTIKHTGIGKTDLGLLKGQISVNKVATLIKLFNNAIPLTEYHQNIKEKQWLKLAINSVINPITAIYNIENGNVTKSELTKEINNILEEIILIASTQGVEFCLSELQGIIIEVANATSLNSSSMRCDILAKRPTEIEYINGYIHRLGKKHGIATPENTRLWQEVNTLVKDYKEIN